MKKLTDTRRLEIEDWCHNFYEKHGDAMSALARGCEVEDIIAERENEYEKQFPNVYPPGPRVRF